MERQEQQLASTTLRISDKPMIRNPGGIGPLVESLGCLEASQSDEALQLLEALCYMSFSPNNCRILVEIGGLKSLFKLLTNWGDTRVGSRAATVVQHLVAACEDLREVVACPEAAEGLVWLLSMGSHEEQEQTARALSTLSDTRARQDLFRRAGVVPALVGALSRIVPGDATQASQLRTFVYLLCRLADCGAAFCAAARQSGDSYEVARAVLQKLYGRWLQPIHQSPQVSLTTWQEQALLTQVAFEVAQLVSGAPSASDIEDECYDNVMSESSDQSFVQRLAETSVPRWRTYGDSQVQLMRRASNRNLVAMAGSEAFPVAEGAPPEAPQLPPCAMRSVASCPLVAGCR